MDGYETKYVRREDFVNDAAWKNFLRYKACRDAQSTTSRKNNYKNKQKINNYEELLKNLKAKDSLSAAQYLEVKEVKNFYFLYF